MAWLIKFAPNNNSTSLSFLIELFIYSHMDIKIKRYDIRLNRE